MMKITISAYKFSELSDIVQQRVRTDKKNCLDMRRHMQKTVIDDAINLALTPHGYTMYNIIANEIGHPDTAVFVSGVFCPINKKDEPFYVAIKSSKKRLLEIGRASSADRPDGDFKKTITDIYFEVMDYMNKVLDEHMERKLEEVLNAEGVWFTDEGDVINVDRLQGYNPEYKYIDVANETEE